MLPSHERVFLASATQRSPQGIPSITPAVTRNSFHFHEDLARMTPDQQKQRVAELLEFAASIKVPSTIDVTPDEEEESDRSEDD